MTSPWPLHTSHVCGDDPALAPEPSQADQALVGVQDDLARSLDAIREIDLDHRAGNLSDADFAELDAEERARAVAGARAASGRVPASWSRGWPTAGRSAGCA